MHIIRDRYITDIERLSAIKKKMRVGEISEKHGQLTYDLYMNHRKKGLFTIAELTASVFKASEFILLKTTKPLRTLDALHLEIAYEHELDIFSFDRVILDVAEEFNIQVLDFN